MPDPKKEVSPAIQQNSDGLLMGQELAGELPRP